jgi:hypothetical protein
MFLDIATISCVDAIFAQELCFLARRAFLLSSWRFSCNNLSCLIILSSLRFRHLTAIPLAIAFKTSASL